MGYTEGDKSAMSCINELAQFNDISYSYELIKEEVNKENLKPLNPYMQMLFRDQHIAEHLQWLYISAMNNIQGKCKVLKKHSKLPLKLL